MGITNAQPLPSTNDTSNPRLALCPSGDDQAGVIVALMESALSKDSSVVLLDRANVQKILAEHNLALSGFLSTDDALKAGQLLQCDIFAELHHEILTNGNTEVTSLVIFDGVTGVRLCDDTLPQKSQMDEVARIATVSLSVAVGKWRGGSEKKPCRTVSLLSVRNVDLPPQRSGIAACIGTILERQLLRSPDVAVLERKRLDRVNKESVLTGDRRDRLLVSAVLIELDLTRQEDGITIRASLEDVTRKNTAVVTVDGRDEDIASLVLNLCRAIVSELHLHDIVSVTESRKGESDRLIAECKRLMANDRWEEARTVAESAVALSPADLPKQNMLCNAIEGVVIRLAQTNAYSEMLNLLDRDMTFREGWLKAQYRPPSFSEIAMALRTLIACQHALDPTMADQLAQLRRRYKPLWEEYYADNVYMADKCDFIDLWAETADVWLEARIPITEFLYLIDSNKVANLSMIGKRRLMQYYEGYAEKGALLGHTRAFEFALVFSNAFPDAEDNFKHHFHAAVDMAADRGPGAVAYLVSIVSYSCPVFSSPHKRIAISELRRLGALVEKKKVFAPNLWLLLDERDGEGSNHPGEYLERGYAQMKAPEFKWEQGKRLMCYNEEKWSFGGVDNDKDYFAEKLNSQYCRKYERDIPGYIKPHPLRETPAWWQCTDRLFTVPQGAFIRSAELDGKWIYLISQFQKPSKYELYRINVVTNDVERVSAIEAELGSRPGNSEIAIGKQACCLVEAEGLLVFPREGGPVQVIRSEVFLPQTRIVSAQEANGRLYLGCNRNLSDSESTREGLLIRCDMDGRHPVILAAGARSEVKSPLDNCGPYLISGFYMDEAKQRLVFPVHSRMSYHNTCLMALDLNTERISLIVPGLTVISPLPSESLGQPRRLTSEIVLIPQGGRDMDAKAWAPASNALTGFDLSSFGMSEQDIIINRWSRPVNAVAVLDGELYYSWQRVSRGQPLSNTPHACPEENALAPIMLRVHEGKVLACTTNALWRLAPKKIEASISANGD
ncbi:MAG: hypothetical protein KKC28_11215 [Verrucomicrobia bacterium]|nr:hypothetical protein [Verrucomicrobiota bacterium]